MFEKTHDSSWVFFYNLTAFHNYHTTKFMLTLNLTHDTDDRELNLTAETLPELISELKSWNDWDEFMTMFPKTTRYKNDPEGEVEKEKSSGWYYFKNEDPLSQESFDSRLASLREHVKSEMQILAKESFSKGSDVTKDAICSGMLSSLKKCDPTTTITIADVIDLVETIRTEAPEIKPLLNEAD